MSRSLNDFQNLNIDEMPETRSQAKHGQQAAGRPRAGRSRARGGHAMHTTTRSDAPIHGHSGLLYDTHNLSPESAQRATEGLLSEFFVDQLRGYETSQGAYYAFQLKKPVSVRIHDPANGVKVECTCEAYQRLKSACVHIYWLFDGLRAVLLENSNATMHTFTQGEFFNQLSELYKHIGQRVQFLPDLLNRTRGDEAESDSENETEKISASSKSHTRKEIVRDILSVFDPSALPSEYGVDFSDHTPASTSANELFVQESLAATIYGIAIRDDVFFRRLSKVVTRDVRAGTYFRKQWVKAKELMAQLDRFAELGPSRLVEARDVNVLMCARDLRLIVHQICENRDRRTADGPLGSEVISKAAEFLVDILYEVVCNHNRDIFGQTPQELSEDQGRDRNLFTYLIGNPPQLDSSAPVAMVDDFVIDCLRDFPATEWSHLLERLTTIMDFIHEHTPRQERAIAFAAKLENMLGEYTTNFYEPSSSAAQRRRPTVTSSRESQRRRFR